MTERSRETTAVLNIVSRDEGGVKRRVGAGGPRVPLCDCLMFRRATEKFSQLAKRADVAAKVLRAGRYAH